MNAQNSSTAFQDKIEANPAPDNIITTNAFPQHRVRTAPPTAGWMEVLRDRFNDVVSLPVGWDGYLGRPVAFTTANFAALILERLYSKNIPAPSIVPGTDGSMQIEWHLNGYDVELDVRGPLDIAAYRFDHLSTNEDELTLGSDITQIAKWVFDLSTDRGFPKQIPA